MNFFKKHSPYEKQELLFEKENKEFFQNLTEDQKALIINFIKVENTGKVINQWDDSLIAVYHKEVVYDGEIKANVFNSKVTISSNNTEIKFEAYSYTDDIIYIKNGFDRLYNIRDQIEQGKITIEKPIMEKAEKMFESSNDKEKDLEKHDENIEEIQEDFSNDFYDDVE